MHISLGFTPLCAPSECGGDVRCEVLPARTQQARDLCIEVDPYALAHDYAPRDALRAAMKLF
jgi:hypothetical protein